MQIKCLNDKVDMAREGYEPSELDKYDIECLAELRVEKVYYWYGQGSYEGAGSLIALNAEGKWCREDISHCSCYGPSSNIIEADFRFDSLASVDAYAANAEAKNEYAALVEAARADQ